MSILKRTIPGSAGGFGVSNKVRKPSGTMSPTKRRRSVNRVLRRSSTPVGSGEDIIERLKIGLGDPISGDSGIPPSPPAPVRAKFKKQMIEKELATVGT